MTRNLLLHKPLLILMFSISFMTGPGVLRESCAQDYQIYGIFPYLAQDSLYIDFSVRDIFSRKLLKPLLAGTPLEVQISAEVQTDNYSPATVRKLSGLVEYDVWEEFFLVHGFGRAAKKFTGQSELVEWISSYQDLSVAARAQLSDNLNYRVGVKLRVRLLSPGQGEQLKEWLRKSNQTEEDLASQERSTGFRLNLSELVQLFFAREDKPEEYVLNGISGQFTLRELPHP